jgi:hypothetical protein
MAAGASAAQPTEPVGEARWPAAGAVLAAIVLTVLLPQGGGSAPAGCSRLLRGLSIALVTVLVLGALSSTVLLIDALVHAVTRDGPGSFSPCRPADTAHRRTTRGGGGGGDG